MIEKGKEVINEKLGWQLFQLSNEWYEKVERKEERKSIINKKPKGYSDKGSLSYPVLTSLMSDLDIILDPDFWVEKKNKGVEAL